MHPLSTSVVTVLLLHLAAPLTATGQERPDGDDDTLRYYLSKSEAVVVGKVTEGLQRVGVDFNPTPVNVIGFQVRVTDPIKGKVAAGQTIMVTLTRALDIGQALPPGQGENVVLFLKSAGDAWVSADKWFGMQAHSRALVGHLKRVNRQAKAPAPAR